MPVCNFQPSIILKLLTKCYCFQYNDSTRYVKQIFILLYLWCALPNCNFSGATFVINIIGHIIRLVGFDKFFNRNAIFLIFCCGNNINSPWVFLSTGCTYMADLIDRPDPTRKLGSMAATSTSVKF